MVKAHSGAIHPTQEIAVTCPHNLHFSISKPSVIKLSIEKHSPPPSVLGSSPGVFPIPQKSPL